MTCVRNRPGVLFVLLAALGLAVVTAVPASASAAGLRSVASAAPAATAAVAASDGANSSHIYGVPAYFPLRNPVRVSCVYSNCPGNYHGHWAINFLGHMGDPLYAAGAGVFHIGDIAPSCSVSPVTQGTWVYVDHGAGGVTRYMHLKSIVAKEGQRVTPDTIIGTLGASGNSNCQTAYTDIEWREGRVGGTRNPIPNMTACKGYTALSYPKALGYSTWNSMPYNDITTPTLSNSCHPTWDQTPAPPSVKLTRSSSLTILVTPSARPAGTDNVRVWMEEYHPSLHAYDSIPTLRDIPVTQSGTHFGGLIKGRNYRFSVAFHNHAGWSNWAPVIVKAAS